MFFNITSEYAGYTVLSYLRSRLKISSSVLSSLKSKENGITVNGVHVTVRHILREGELLSINEKDSFQCENSSIEPHNIPLDIIFENDDIMIVNKPAFMPTHPSHLHTDDTIANALAYIYRERHEPFVFRPIGRLDRNTSGLSLISKNPVSASFLSYARKNRMITKKYIALLQGHIDSDGTTQVIDNYMKRADDSIIVRCVSQADDPDSFRAVTHWRLLYSDSSISVVEAIPQTGRTHQLRVHFAHIGHQIIGDDIYGSGSELIGRHALHAFSLSLPLPYSTSITKFTSQTPSDMESAFRVITGKELEDVLKHNCGE